MIAAVVPAAGQSRRMGQPKLLLTLDGETLIHRVVTALRRGGADRVIVIAPPADAPEGPAIAAEAGRAGAEVSSPQARPAEMRHSVELGLEVLEQGPPPRLVILCPADSPGITQDLVARLLDVALQRPDGLILPCHEGRRGHPIVLPWDVASEIRALPTEVGINVLVARHPDRIIEVPVPDPNLVADLDTPEDLDRWSRESIPRRDDSG